MEGLTHITINGETYPVYFGMEAVEYFSKKQEQFSGSTTLGIRELSHVVYGGLLNHATINDQALALPFASVYVAVENKYYDEEGQKELKAIADAFTDSRAVKHLQKVAEGEAKKKKK